MKAEAKNVTGGVWFTKEGLGFKVGHEENAAFYALSRYAKKLLPFYPSIIDWVASNPATTSSVDAAIAWNRRLAAEFVREGWHLLWCGQLITSAETTQVTADLARLEKEVTENIDLWPPNTRIYIYSEVGGEKIGQELWSRIRGNVEPNMDTEPPVLAVGSRHKIEATHQPLESITMTPKVSSFRTYSLHDFSFSAPDGRDVTESRPLTVTVGTQALEPGIENGKTLIRFGVLDETALLEQSPRMRVKICRKGASDAPTVIEDADSVELMFDNKSFLSQQKEMPFWLVETLEFAAKKLREQYALNQDGELRFEALE